MNVLDLKGQKFNRLTVLERKENTRKGSTRWLCKCECGKEIVAIGTEVKKGHTKSCGCLSLERTGAMNRGKPAPTRMKFGESSIRLLYLRYKANARTRKLPFDLVFDETFFKLTSSNCHFCGVQPKQKCTSPTNYGYYIYNGIDRLDSASGYSLDNCVPCCKDCNQMKLGRTVGEFLSHIQKINKHCTEIFSK